MIDLEDLKAAVASGLLTERQAAGLRNLSNHRRSVREAVNAGDEPFELFRGFNEIFIVAGLATLAVGWIGIVAAWAIATGPAPVSLPWIWGLAGAAVLWGLSEYFVRRRRMVAPSIMLSVLFALNAGFAFASIFSDDGYVISPLVLALTTGAMLVHWARFRVPFALALIALGVFAVAIVTTAMSEGRPSGVSSYFLLSADGSFAWITLLLGSLAFCVAMIFDMSDPHRVTRQSANGFWLHIVAAPMLVNTIALTLLARESGSANVLLLMILALLTIVAIVIDRRSFLIAGIGYIVTLATAVFDGEGAYLTVLLLGAALLLLGALWERVRAFVIKPLPKPLLARLPPSYGDSA